MKKHVGGLKMRLRFIHTADLHLDSSFKGLQQLPENIRQRIVQSTLTAFNNMIDGAIDQKVDFVLFAGDIYDRASRSLRAQLQFKRGIERLSEEGISSYIIHGNHDPLEGKYISLEWPETVHFFGSDRVTRIPFLKKNQEVASIYGFSYAMSKVTENKAKEFSKQQSDSFSIALLHTNCDGAADHENYAPCTKRDLLDAGFDYWALGHVHTRKVLHEYPPIVYPGNLQGRHIREQGEKGFYYVEVDSLKNITLSFQPVQDVLWLEEEIDFTEINQIDDVFQLMDDRRHQLHGCYPETPLIVRIIGKGETSLGEELSRKDIVETLVEEWQSKEAYQENFVWLESFRFQGQMFYEREELRASQGVFSDIMNMVEEANGDEALRESIIEEALSELFTHHRARKILDPFRPEEQQEILQKAEAFVLFSLIGGDRK
jgi:exonuclease SbcD